MSTDKDFQSNNRYKNCPHKARVVKKEMATEKLSIWRVKTDAKCSPSAMKIWYHLITWYHDYCHPLKLGYVSNLKTVLFSSKTFHLSLQKHHLKTRIQISSNTMKGLRNLGILGRKRTVKETKSNETPSIICNWIKCPRFGSEDRIVTKKHKTSPRNQQ